MTVILADDPSAAPAVADWPIAVDRVVRGDVGAAVAGYDIAIPADHMPVPPTVSGAVRAALVVTDLESAARVLGWDTGLDVVFAPSPLARLDRLRASRRTLLAARRLAAGAVLTDADLATEADGLGIAESLRDAAVGRRLIYDLEPGQPIDFGVLSEEREGA